jgi:hypothetical protein
VLPSVHGSRHALASSPAARITAWSIPPAPAAMKNSSNHLVRDAAYPEMERIRSAMCRCGSSQPRVIASSMNTSA